MYITTINSFIEALAIVSGLFAAAFFILDGFGIAYKENYGKLNIKFILLSISMLFIIISFFLKGKVFKEQETECLKPHYIGFYSTKCKTIRDYQFQQETLLQLHKQQKK